MSINGGFATTWQQQAWKSARIGVIIFCLLQIVFEAIINGGKGMFVMLVANYIISTFFIKRRIRDEKLKSKALLKGLLVSFIVFIVRVVMGVIYTVLVEMES